MQKSYLYWPYLQELDTRIIRAFKEEDAYFVELERTLFYPHLSGGQPEDRGTIDGIPVLHVRENAGKIEHQVQEEMQEGDVTLVLDWDRRYEHMQQHTAQHILSGLFDRLYGIATVGFMIGESVSTIDIDAAERHNAESIIEGVCALANRLCISALPVHRSFAKTEQKTAEPVRLIHIPTMEATKCGGTHVGNTAECGPIRITKIQKDRGHLRLTYLAGARCLREYDALKDAAEKLAERFGTSLLEGFERAHGQLDRIRALEDKNKVLMQMTVETLKPTLRTPCESHRGYHVLVRAVAAPVPLRDLVKDTAHDLVLLVNSEGAFYCKMKQIIPQVIKHLETLKDDPNFKGGGNGLEWYGQFLEGAYENALNGLWVTIRDDW